MRVYWKLYILMCKLEEKIDRLREIIKEKSFVTKDQHKIFSKSGEESAWLFDIKKIILDPEALNLITGIFWEKFGNEYPFQTGGQEVTALPLLGAIIQKGNEIGKPVSSFFIRKSRKKDGLQKIVEGEVGNSKIILIDDIINSGQTIDRQIKILEKERKKIDFVFTLVNFRESTDYNFLKERRIKLVSLYPVTDFGLDFVTKKTDIPQNYFNVIWHFQSQNPDYFHVVPKSTPALDDDKIYFGSDSGIFWALDQKNGKIAWKYEVMWFKQKGIFSSPALHGDNVYFGAYDGNVYCLDKNTGERKWMFMEADWVGSSPAVAENLNLLFIGLEFGLIKKQGGIAALDLDSGKKKWEFRMMEFVHASPAYCCEREYVAIGANDGKMRMFRAKDGKLIWEYQTGGDVKYRPTYDVGNGVIAFGSMDGNLYVCDIESGELIALFKTEAGIYSTPLFWEDKIIFTSLDKSVYCWDYKKNKILWIFHASGRIFASPVLIEGSVFVGSNDGRMYELDPDTGKLKSFFQFLERITNEIVCNSDAKKFFVLTHANELFCLARQYSTA